MGYTKIIQTDNSLEIYSYEKDYIPSKKRSYRKNKRKAKKQDDSRAAHQYRRQSSILRAKQSFFRLVEANIQKDIFPALATFTLYENLTLTEAYEALRTFFYNISGENPNLSYIAVPEWQKRGTLHFHALVWGFDPKTIFNEVPYYYRKISNRKRFSRFIEFCTLHGFEPKESRGTRNLQRCWGRGFFDILGATNNNRALAGYLTKYLVKGLSDIRLSNNRAYTSSYNIKRPRTYGSNEIDFVMDLVYNEKDRIKDIKSYKTLYLGQCDYKKTIKYE